jgi:hypothetical protein
MIFGDLNKKNKGLFISSLIFFSGSNKIKFQHIMAIQPKKEGFQSWATLDAENRSKRSRYKIKNLE